MVNFIKENLLGSVKEFRNRFINPIQNGQCADSTLQDVRIMKKRAHILYEMLAGCVQVDEKKTATGIRLLTYLCASLKADVFLLSAEERLHSAHQVPATETRVCVVDQSDSDSVQTLQILFGALHR